MEHTIVESGFIQEVTNEATDNKIHELNDLQLAFIGGGIGDPVAA